MQLEMFNAVAETGSITQAAAKVHYIPPGLITCIRQLETDLGIDLSICKNQRLRLFLSGHNFLRYSQWILVLVEEVRMVVTGDEPQGLLSLGSLENTAVVRIPAALAEYGQRYPKIQLALTTGPSGTMLDDVLDGTLNAVFVDGPITHPGLEGTPVYCEEMMTVTPNSHPSIKRASDVNGCSTYTFRTNCSYRRHFESWLRVDRAVPSTIHEMESYHSIPVCVVAGADIVLIPRPVLESVPGHHQVNAWPLSKNQYWLNTWLVWCRGAIARQLEAFIEVLNPQLSQSPG